ncbi:hypothetical protein C8F01DRAFT_463666 [Mycena amicta]|nr:hypothetical protein C8F01DRAFT_463666 [Mycena amicta]
MFGRRRRLQVGDHALLWMAERCCKAFKQAQTGSKRKRSPPMPRAAGPSRQETTMENEEEVNAEVLPPKMRKLASPNWLPPVQSPVPYTLPWRRLVTYVPPVYGADYVGEFKLVPAFPTFGTSEPPGNVGVGQTNAAAHSSIATQPGTIDGSTGGAHGAKVQQPNNAAAKDGQETEQLEDVHPPSASIVNGADATNSMQPNEFTHDVHALSQTRIDELSQDGVACQARNWATQLEHMFLDEQGKLPSVEDMEEIELENDHLTYAGLPNVLRLIADLGSDCAPCDTRYDFKGRAGKLITRWSDQLRAHVRTTGTAGRGTDVKVDGGVNADEPHDEGCDVDVENKTELCL